jgi:hypothetical protein
VSGIRLMPRKTDDRVHAMAILAAAG